jgi:predicted nucleic acid-binding protein
MKLADTCVWIEVLADTPTGGRYRGLFDVPAQLVVPTLVQYELRRWALRELGEDAADRVIAATRAAHIVVLDEPTALHAAALAMQFKLSSADALIYATSLRHQAELVTCDAHFEGLPGVNFQAKLPG